MQWEWGKHCMLEWFTEKIQNQIEDVGIDSKITKYKINLSRGCERKVQLEFYIMLFPYNFLTINYFNIHHYICFNLNKWSFTRKEISNNAGIRSTISCRTCTFKETILRLWHDGLIQAIQLIKHKR